MKSRGNSRTYQPKKPRNGLKECERGTSCPFRNEYQHQLEFSHDKDVGTIKSEAAFASNKGNKLGGSMRDNSRLIEKSHLPSNSNNYSTSPNNSMSPNNNDIFCENCYQFISAVNFEKHLSTHQRQSSSDSLKKSQDLEYDNSLIADLEREESVRAKERKDRDEKLAKEEEASLLEAIAISKQMATAGAFQLLVLRSQEPTSYFSHRRATRSD